MPLLLQTYSRFKRRLVVISANVRIRLFIFVKSKKIKGKKIRKRCYADRPRPVGKRGGLGTALSGPGPAKIDRTMIIGQSRPV
jgi:hypothetical protein